MQIRYDEDFVEAAVFLCASGRRAGVPPLQIVRFNREREKCYALPEPDDRNAAFFRLHLEWLREWGLERLLQDLLKEFPLLAPSLDVLAWRKARTKNDEGAELYVGTETGRNAVVALRVERFENDALLARFLRHEFMHLNDMVDPAFVYSSELRLHGPVPTPQRVVRERYRLLWDITIDGRLRRAGREIQTGRESYETLFGNAYSFWPDTKRREVFDELWMDATPRHARLLEMASDPRGLTHAQGPIPGGSCPLCGFPTFEWADASALTAQPLNSLRAQFPDWMPEQGACKRCLEIYQTAGKFEIPPTMRV